MLNLPHSPILPLPVTAEQRVLVIPRDQLEKAIDNYGGKDKKTPYCYFTNVYFAVIEIDSLLNLSLSPVLTLNHPK